MLSMFVPAINIVRSVAGMGFESRLSWGSNPLVQILKSSRLCDHSLGTTHRLYGILNRATLHLVCVQVPPLETNN